MDICRDLMGDVDPEEIMHSPSQVRLKASKIMLLFTCDSHRIPVTIHWAHQLKSQYRGEAVSVGRCANCESSVEMHHYTSITWIIQGFGFTNTLTIFVALTGVVLEQPHESVLKLKEANRA